MKPPIYSVAVIAMCLLVACKSSADKSYKTQDVTLSKVEADSPVANELAKPNSEKLTVPQVVTNNLSSGATDTIAEVVGQPSPTVLQSGGPNTDDWDKKIIKTARVSLELKDYKSFNTTIH